MPGSTTGAPLTGDVVRIEIAPLPAHVRTARLVGGATARRAGLSPEDVDELKLAIGEAATRAVDLHAAHAPDELVEITLSWNASALSVEVSDRGPADELLPPDEPEDDLALSEEPGGLALAVVQGLVEDVTITPRDAGGTTVRMRWPLPPEGFPGDDL